MTESFGFGMKRLAGDGCLDGDGAESEAMQFAVIELVARLSRSLYLGDRRHPL